MLMTSEESQQYIDYPQNDIAGLNDPGNYAHGILAYQLDVDDIIRDIEMTLRQEEYILNDQGLPISQQKQVKGRIVQPLCSDELISEIRLLLKSRLTKVFALSDFDEETINNITITVAQQIKKKMCIDWHNCGIKDIATASMILHLISDNVYAVLRKGYNANYLTFLKTTSRIQDVTHVNQSNQNKSDKQSVTSMLNPFSRYKR